MSRCFPFPPPGYEKKARADEENLLNKEKKKENKHKKEKKNREGKEKKEKERSEVKQKEKKERKEKHKDKKDKHKDKERGSVSVEKLGPSLVQNAQNSDANFILELGKRIGNSDERSAERNLLVHKFTLTYQGNYEMPVKDKGEDQRKVNGQQNGVGGANGFIQKFEGVHQRTLEGVGGLMEKVGVKRREGEENNKQISGESRDGEQENNKLINSESRDGEQKERDSRKKIGMGLLLEKPIAKRSEQKESNKQKNADTSDTKHLLELGKRTGNNDERLTEKNLLVHKFTLTGQGNYEMARKDTGDNQRKVNGRQNGVVAANGFIQNLERVHQKTLEGVGGLMEKSVEKRREREENNKQINGEQKERDSGKKIGAGLRVEKLIDKGSEEEESNKQKNGASREGKHKDKDGERKSKLKDKKRDKEKEKEEIKIEKQKEKELKKELLKQRENEKPAADGDNVKTASDLPKERSGGEGSVGKRKELETNGFLHDTGIRPSKLLRPASSTHQIVENGRTTEPFKPAIRFVEDLKGNKKILSSSSVPVNGRTMETLPRFVEDLKGNKTILSSPSVPVNGKILEPSPKTISSTHQLVMNGSKPEPSKTAIRFVTEYGEGNKKVTTSLSVAGNGKVIEPCPEPKPIVSIKENVTNGRNSKHDKAEVRVVAEGEGESKKGLSSFTVVETVSKMEPPTPSLPAPENGRKLELSRSIDQSASGGGNVVVINQKVDSTKEIIVNGKHEGQQPSVSLKRPSPSSKQVKEKVKSKLPHPDSKFLDSIYSVPKVELSDLVDQEWLFGSSNLQQAKRSKTGSSQVEGLNKQVWAEALHVESADIFALPYVIPY